MRILKRVLDFYIFSNIHVALAVFCLTKITLTRHGIENNLLPLFVFFSTIASYNFIRLYRISKIQGWVFQFIKTYKRLILAITILSGLIALFIVFKLAVKTIFLVIPLGFFTLFYVVPIPIKKNNKVALRSVAFLKLFLIAISWASVTVLIPYINYNSVLDSEAVLIFIQRFLFVLVITIPFDIRDVRFDTIHLRTLPQVIGIKQSKIFGLFLILVFLGLEVLKTSSNVTQFRVHLAVALVSLYFLFRATDNQPKYYSALFVESIPIFWYLLIMIS